MDEVNPDELLVEIVTLTGKAGNLRKSREAALVVTKLEEARLWLQEYCRSIYTSGERYCTTCEANPGQPCRNEKGPLPFFHDARRQ